MVKESIQRAGFLFRALTKRRLDGLDLLEADHVKVEMLFLRWRLAAGGTAREEIFSLIKKELLDHSHLEETVFYPACAKVMELRRLVSTALEDHKLMKSLLKEISELPQNQERTTIKMRVLIDEVQHHIHEEENVLFPRIRLIMKKGQLEKLSRDIRLTKEGRTQKIAA